MRYCCNKCGSVKVEYKDSGTQGGIWCKDCGKWIKWLNKEERELFKKQEQKSNKVDLEVMLKEILKELKEIKNILNK